MPLGMEMAIHYHKALHAFRKLLVCVPRLKEPGARHKIEGLHAVGYISLIGLNTPGCASALDALAAPPQKSLYTEGEMGIH